MNISHFKFLFFEKLIVFWIIMDEKEFKYDLPKKFSFNNFIFSENILWFCLVKIKYLFFSHI